MQLEVFEGMSYTTFDKIPFGSRVYRSLLSSTTEGTPALTIRYVMLKDGIKTDSSTNAWASFPFY